MNNKISIPYRVINKCRISVTHQQVRNLLLIMQDNFLF